jgi:hypothetical protein
MQLAEHVIFADIDIEDDAELEQFSRQASAVVGWDMRAGIVLDAFDSDTVNRLRAGELGWLRYDEHSEFYGPVGYSYLICLHPPSDRAKREENATLRERVLASQVRPGRERALPLPVGSEWVVKALARGGGKLHVDMMRMEAQVYVTEQMATALLAGRKVPVLEEDARGLLSHGFAGYELFIPYRARPGEVAYRRLH